jgi:hypothetical protein
MKYLIVFMTLVLVTGCASSQHRYLASNPNLSKDVAEAILKNNIVHGMTKENVRVSVGDPEKTHGYIKDGRLIELWIYSEFAWHELEEIIFENGFVIGWNLPDSVKKRLEEEAVVELLEKVSEHRTTSSFISPQTVGSGSMGATQEPQVAEMEAESRE